MDIYHIQCPSLPRVMKITDARIRAVMARLKDYSEEELETAFVKAENSPFLRGEKKDWHADFDWIMEPKHLIRILEGTYDDRIQQQKDTFNENLEKWAKGSNNND